jgi:hypothetical protein
LPSDFGLIDAAKISLADSQETSNRDAVTAATEPSGCRGCHLQINPLGFTFEGFDQLGMPREAETIVGDDGAVLRTLPIDTRVSAVQIGPGTPIDLADSKELGRALGSSELARACFSERLFEYYRRAALDGVDDACLIADTLASDYRKDGQLSDDKGRGILAQQLARHLCVASLWSCPAGTATMPRLMRSGATAARTWF